MRNRRGWKIISATIHPPVDADLNSLLRSRWHAREARRWRGAITLTEEIQEEEGSNGKISNVGGIRFDVPLHKAYEHVNLQLPGMERGQQLLLSREEMEGTNHQILDILITVAQRFVVGFKLPKGQRVTPRSSTHGFGQVLNPPTLNPQITTCIRAVLCTVWHRP